jgi:hypothetical protein
VWKRCFDPTVIACLEALTSGLSKDMVFKKMKMKTALLSQKLRVKLMPQEDGLARKSATQHG